MNISTFVVCGILLNFAFVCGFALCANENVAPMAKCTWESFMNTLKR